ncbi:MAG: hypothetical protein ABI232_10140, partial [Jatrophihabitantaceae bacterium]
MVEKISHWLRAVRPKTAADEDWAGSEQADDVLGAIHARTAVGNTSAPSVAARSRARVPRRIWAPATILVAAAAVTVAIVSGSSGGTAGTVPTHPQAVPPLPAIRPAAMLLSKDSSCASLLADLRAHTAASV